MSWVIDTCFLLPTHPQLLIKTSNWMALKTGSWWNSTGDFFLQCESLLTLDRISSGLSKRIFSCNKILKLCRELALIVIYFFHVCKVAVGKTLGRHDNPFSTYVLANDDGSKVGSLGDENAQQKRSNVHSVLSPEEQTRNFHCTTMLDCTKGLFSEPDCYLHDGLRLQDND